MTSDIPPGWYPDPLRDAEERYWDGTAWTRDVRSDEASSNTARGEVVPPPPPSTGRPRTGVSTAAFGAVLVSAVALAGLVALLLLRGNEAETETRPEATTAATSAAPETERTNGDPALTTTAPPNSSTTTVEPASTSTTSQATTTSSTAPATTLATTTTSQPPLDQVRAEPIDVMPAMVTATCQGSNGVEGDLVTPVIYAPSNVVDNVLSTAWRCNRNDVLSGSLLIRLDSPTRITRVGMVPGYDKLDPYNSVDRFTQNHRVARARWEFDDGNIVIVDYADNRQLQFADIDVLSSTVRVVVEDFWPSSGTLARDMIAISEIVLVGIP